VSLGRGSGTLASCKGLPKCRSGMWSGVREGTLIFLRHLPALRSGWRKPSSSLLVRCRVELGKVPAHLGDVVPQKMLVEGVSNL